jgi:hypothetical protein
MDIEVLCKVFENGFTVASEYASFFRIPATFYHPERYHRIIIDKTNPEKSINDGKR